MENMMALRSISIYFPAPALTCFLFACIILTCQAGDYLIRNLHHPDENTDRLIRALADSVTHSAVGGLCWAVVEGPALLSTWRAWANCAFCAFLSGAVDLDHFLAAGALDLKKATHLQERPPFHNSSLIVLVIVTFEVLHFLASVPRLPWLMFTISWLSHHLRDANRRGLWFYPYGSTPSLPALVYIVMTLLLTVIVRLIYAHSSPVPNRVIVKDPSDVTLTLL